MKGNFQKLNEIKVFKMATIFQINQILNESKNKTINVAWLQIAIMGTNVDGAISKYIEPFVKLTTLIMHYKKLELK